MKNIFGRIITTAIMACALIFTGCYNLMDYDGSEAEGNNARFLRGWEEFNQDEIIIFLIQPVLFITDILLCIEGRFFSLSTEAAANIVMEMFGMVICEFLYFSVLIDDRKSRFRDLFLFMLFHECLILFLEHRS